MAEELQPIDSTQCQAEIKAGSFMTFGSRYYVRCSNPPEWIVVEIKEGLFFGAMALCDECKGVCEIRMPLVSYQKLNR